MSKKNDQGAQAAGKLTLSKETLRKLRVKSDVRTGFLWNPSNTGCTLACTVSQVVVCNGHSGKPQHC